MSSYTIILMTVLVLYLLANLGIGLFISKKQAKIDAEAGTGFINNYFIGGRSMGGLVLAMTLIATFTSASSFIGGPGVAYSKGLVWVYLSIIQVPTAFIILGILGKKFAIISRKTNAVTVTDYLKARYKSPAVVIISSIALVLFFIAQMMSQFIGGAVLFQTITGLPYVYGLLLFGAIVILYTTIGGFKAVVTTDTIQGLVMVMGGFIILFTIVKVGGGFEAIVEKLNVVNPTWNDPTVGGTTPKAYVMSFWVLVGIGVLGLPQTAVRGMGFKDTKSLHSAMIYGTIVVGFLMLVMHISGAFAPAILDPTEISSSDYVVPTLVLKYMNPVVAGLFIAAPLSAVMSTVSSLLILASAAIIKDIYLNYIAKEKGNVDKTDAKFEKKIGKMSMITTLFVGVIVFVFTIYPPDLIVWINLFAMGGLECAFLCPILFGLYWKRANATGAVLSSVIGVVSFLLMTTYKVSIFGTTPIVPSIVISIVVFVIGSLIGKKPDEEIMKLFYS
ncbi:sodium/pantothenate symporter [Anaerotignum propionicum]|uniref:sodium/pantothenate symporter n=1 Tax=Anaerotignum propionicum TaxID=28446 RepID=UPI002898A412|nr:sodium/pantothenate symporter [Anaerotignum propionicum]